MSVKPEAVSQARIIDAFQDLVCHLNHNAPDPYGSLLLIRPSQALWAKNEALGAR